MNRLIVDTSYLSSVEKALGHVSEQLQAVRKNLGSIQSAADLSVLRYRNTGGQLAGHAASLNKLVERADQLKSGVMRSTELFEKCECDIRDMMDQTPTSKAFVPIGAVGGILGVVGGLGHAAVSGGNTRFFGNISGPGGKAEWSAGISSKDGLYGKIKGEGSLLSGSAGIKNEFGQIKLEGSVGNVYAKGEAKFALTGKDGPVLKLGGGLAVSAASIKLSERLGNDQNNVFAEGKVDMGYVKAGGNISISKDGIGGKAEVGVAAVKGEAKAGFTIFGVKVDIGAEGELASVGAKAEFGATKDSVSLGGKLSFLAGLGLKIKVSW